MKRYDARGNVIGEHRFLGLYTSSARTPASPIDVPGAAAQGRARSSSAPGSCPRATTRRISSQILETYPARRPVPDRRRPPLRHRDGHPAAAGTPAGAPVRAPRAVRPLRVVPRVPPPRPLHDAGARAHRAAPRRRVRRRRATSGTRACRSRCSPACTSCCTSTRRGARRRSTSPSSRQRVAAAARAWVDDLRDALVARARRGRRASTCSASGPTRSRARTRTTSTRPRRSPTSRSSTRSDDGTPARGAAHDRAPTTSTSSSTASARSRRSPTCCRASPNMGVIVDDEHPYDDHARRASSPAGSSGSGSAPGGHDVDPGARCDLFEEAFLAVVDGRAEDDGVQPARARRRARRGARSRCSRAYCRYLRQAGTPFSQTLHRGHARPRTPTSRAGSSSCSSPASTRGRGSNGAATGDGDARERLADEIRAELDAVDEPRRRPHPARAAAPRARDAAHELVPGPTPTASRAVRRAEARPARDPRPARSRARCSSSSCTRRASKACTCARARSRAAASAGRTGAKTSAPRCSG